MNQHASRLILAASSGVYRNFFFCLCVPLDFLLDDVMASVSVTCRQMKSNEPALALPQGRCGTRGSGVVTDVGCFSLWRAYA